MKNFFNYCVSYLHCAW